MKCYINNLEKYSVVLGELLFATLVFIGVLVSYPVSAYDTVIDQVNVSVPASCSLSGTGMTSHNAEIQNGQYNSSIGETTLKAYCNDSEGFAIYAVGFTDNTHGKNALTSSTLDSAYNIVTGTATSGATSNWAMKISTISSPTPTYPITIQNSYGSFHNVPATYELVASRSSGTDIGQSAEGSTLKTTYQAYISGTQAAGTYTGQVKYTLVHPANETPLQPVTCNSGKICYNPNSGTVLGTMGQQTISTSATSATLLASNFSREGYGFAGWSNKYDYATNTDSDLKFYGPSETISFTAGQYTGSNPGLSLYAVWVKSEGNLQDSTKVAQLCGTGSGSLTQAPIDGTANLASVSALTDQRDNETYAIAKLADGNCWMIENLRLEAENTTGATNKSLAQGYAESTTFGNFIGLANAQPASDFTETNPPAANSLYSTDGSTTVTIQGGNNSFYYQRIPRYNNVNTPTLANVANRPQNPIYNSATNSTSGAGMYSYGNYYSWTAALANIIEYTSPTAQVDGYTSETVNTSICPTGWRLPYGRSTDNGATSGGFYYLATQMSATANNTTSSNKFRSFPNNFLYSGFVYSGSVNYRGSYGEYWSSTASNSDNAHLLRLQSSNFYPGIGNGGYKYHGRSIRCVVDS